MRRILHALLQVNIHSRVPMILALGMTLGAIWYFSIDFEPALITIGMASIAAAVMFFWRRRRSTLPILFLLIVLVLGATLGTLSGKLATARVTQNSISEAIGPVLVEGWVTRAEPARRGVRLNLRLHAIDGLPKSETPGRIRLTHIAGLKVEPGRFVRCWAVLRPPPPPVIEGDYEFDRQAWYGGLGAVGYVQGRCRGGTLGPPQGWFEQTVLMISKLRRQLATHVLSESGERAGGFAAALASGDRSFMPQEDQEALRGSGLAHLLAISGLHMGIVGGLIYLIVWRGLALIEPIALRFTVRKPAAIAGLIACSAYLVISGASVSTQRAFVMAAVFFGAILMDRAALSLRSLAIAMIIIIALAPWSVLTPGYQMSFAATGALIATYEAWQRRLRQVAYVRQSGPVFWAKSLIVTSTVSSLATMPFAIFHFDRVAGFGLLANFAAMPIVSLATAPLAAAALLLAPLGLDGWALRSVGYSLEAILAVAHYFDGLVPNQHIPGPPMPAGSLGWLAIAIILACLLKGVVLRFLGFLLPVIAAAGLWLTSGTDQLHWAPSGDLFLVQANGQAERIKLSKGDGLAPLRYADLAISQSCENERICMFELGARKIAYVPSKLSGFCQSVREADIVLTSVPSSTCRVGAAMRWVEWGDVITGNGVTLSLEASRIVEKKKPPCGSRPWRLCSEDN